VRCPFHNPGKVFPGRFVKRAALHDGALLALNVGMTIIPRDSDVIGAAVLLAVVLITGIRALL